MSRTDENLHAAFAGESMARNKYTYFAKVAQKEGLHAIAKVFLETADNEMRHAKDHFLLLGGLGDTKANLKAAADGEHYEVTEMYPEFARIAREEGNTKAALLFDQIAKVEARHEARYKELLEQLEAGTLYKRDEPIEWKCDVCGWTHTGKEAPGKCPCCGHPQGHFLPGDVF
jgi:rubrerythrin